MLPVYGRREEKGPIWVSERRKNSCLLRVLKCWGSHFHPIMNSLSLEDYDIGELLEEV